MFNRHNNERRIASMSILMVKDLNKRYEKFSLKNVSFSLDKGYIMGFIGSNGAGKTTTIKSILNLVKKDSGIITVFDKEFSENEIDLKSDIGFMLGGVDFFPNVRIKKITDVTKRFYQNWDDSIYNNYIERFRLDEDKKLKELSNGMKVKYSLALALSHNAKLFILDEPTSGLDPVARDDMLELFQELIEDGEKSILFSTHITSDLEKCADFITYINDGEIIASTSKDEFIDAYRIVKGSIRQLDSIKHKLISHKTTSFGFSGLMKYKYLTEDMDIEVFIPRLEDIMIYYAKRRI